MQDRDLPGLKEAVGADAYDHRPGYRMAIRTNSLGSPVWNAGYQIAHLNSAQQRPGACAYSVQAINTNMGHQHSPHLHSSGPYSRQPSLSTSSVNLSAAESVGGYCTSPATTSCSSKTFGKSKSRKRASSKNARRDGQTGDPNKIRMERRRRSDQGGLIRELEDILMNYCGTVVGSIQNTGNKNRSGLQYKKDDNLKNAIALLLHFLDKEYKPALLNDTVAELQAEWVQIQKECREPTNPDRDPAYHTLMRGTDAPCIRGNDEVCAKHGEPDWTACHTNRVDETFKRNEAIFLRAQTQ